MGNQTPQSQYSQAYGWHEVVTVDENTVVEKTYVMTSKHERDSFERLLKVLKEIRCDTFLNFNDVFEANGAIIVQFQYISQTLAQEVRERKEQYIKYSEKEILNLMDCVVSSLMLLSFKGLEHLSLHPDTIFIRSNPKKYAICYPKLIGSRPCKDNPVKQHPNNNLSHFTNPEQLSQSPVSEKSDIFSLGLISLYLCVLQPISSIFSSTVINQYQIFQFLSNLSQDYSSSFINLLRQMLVIPLEERIGLSETSQLLQRLIEDESSLKFANSNSKLMNKRIESERYREMEENGIDCRLPTYCFLAEKEFIDELYGGKVESGKGRGSLAESRRSNRTG